MQSQRGVSRPANTFTQRLATTPSGQGPSVGTWGYTDAGDVWVAAVDSGATGQSLWVQMVSSASIAIPVGEVAFGTGTGITGDSNFFYTQGFGLLAAGRAVFTEPVATAGQTPILEVIGDVASTPLTLSTEAPDVYWNLARTVTFATGALAVQRAVSIDPPTYAFVGASALTIAATMAVNGAPIQGTNATIANGRALWITEGTTSPGARTSLWVDGAINDGGVNVVPAGVEQSDFVFNGNRTVTFAAGALAVQRTMVVIAPELAFDGASTVTEAVGLDVGAPQAGANATLTASYAVKGSAGAAANNTVLPVAAFFRYVTGGAGASGIGASLRLMAESAGSAQRTAVELQGVLDDATNTTENSSWRVLVLGAGAASQGEAFRVAAAVGTIVNRITVTGSATGNAASVTAAGEANTPLTLSSSGLGAVTLTPGRDGLVVTPRVSTAGTPVGILYNGQANTGVTAATESNDLYLSLGRTVTWASGAGPLAQQRAIRIDSPIYAGTGVALTITEAATLWIQDAPSAGANMTLTTAYAFMVAAGRVRFNGIVVQNDYPTLKNTGTVGAPVTTINTPRGITVIANGATSVAVTCAACTAETIIHPTIMNATTNNVSIRACIPGAGSFVVHVTGDPGASGAIIGVTIIQPTAGT
jgi:hypothetical protein